MTLQFDDYGNAYDDGVQLTDRAPLQITVDGTPPVLQNPDSLPFDVAASRLKGSVFHQNPLPVNDDRWKAFGPANPERPSYMIEPDLQEAQGGQHFPAGLMQEDSGRLYYQDDPNSTIPLVRRPNLLPIANTPEGFKFAMPRMLDIVGNVMGNVAGGKVAAKAGEMVLGSGMTRTMNEATQTGPFYSALERVVEQAKVNLATPEQWLGYLRNQPGVKAEELQHVLGELPKEGMISKAQLNEFVKQNKVELKEKVLGGNINNPLLNQGYDKAPKEIPQTKYHQYQLPGGENYQELLLSLPQKLEKRYYELREKSQYDNGLTKSEREEWNKIIPQMTSDKQFLAPHFDEHGKNLLAHARLNDRTIEGNKSLHIEEIQSDWHQKGRKQGYVGEKEKLQPEFDKVEEKLMNSNDEKMLGLPKVEDVLKEAVDKKLITKNEADVYKRYTDIENASPVPDAPFKKNWDELALKRIIHEAAKRDMDAISWTPGEAQAARYDLSKKVDYIDYRMKSNGTYELGIVDKDGGPVHVPNELTKSELADVVGKEIAEKIINGEGKSGGGRKTLKNVDLKIGGEGMIKFYDKMLVDKANAIAKKYGSKVEQREIEVGKGKPTSYDNFDAYRKAPNSVKHKIHYLPLTPELKKKALDEGFPLFSSSPVIIPVDHDPFKDDKKQYRLKSVDYQPEF